MTRTIFLAASLGAFFLSSACGPGQVIVTAEHEAHDPEEDAIVTRSISGLEIQLLPYDRDGILDSLEAAHPEPEPEIPQELLERREAVAEAQQNWRQAEARWQLLRDSLQQISNQMEGLARGEQAYRELFQRFQQVEGQMDSAENEMNESFEEFTELQRGIIEESEEVRLARDRWADAAFADALQVFQQRIRETGMDPVVDTTDANGRAVLQARPGQWWIHARHQLPFTELYWNLPIEVERGDPMELILNEENAEVRPNL